MKNRKIILTVVILIVITSTIIMNRSGIEEETTEYIFPEMLVIAAGQTQESTIEELKPCGSKDDLVTSIRKGDDGSIIVELTDKQRKKWLNDIEETIEQCEENAEKIGCEIIVNDERTEFIHEVYRKADIKQVSENTTLVTTRCMQYQIFNGASPDEIKLKRIIINIETGKVMADIDLGEDVTIDPEDWDE